MYKRKRINSEEMDDSQTTSSLVTPSNSNTSLPSTSNITNSDNNEVNSSQETIEEGFNTAKFSTDNTDKNTTPSNEALYRTLRNLRGKTIQCEHHIKTMEDNIINGTTPRGLQSNLQPNVPSIDTILIRQWEGVKLEFQSKLLVCLRDYWVRHHSSLLDKCGNLEEELRSKVNPEVWSRMEKQIETTMEATKNNYNKPRRQQNQRRNQGGLSRGNNGRN
jgi:hypothetical protein